MTRSRYIRLRMAAGLSRNQAAFEARSIQSVGLPYSDVSRLCIAFSGLSEAFRCLGSVCLAVADAADCLRASYADVV